MATFTVTNTNDSGAGSLRQAIADAGALAGDDAIVFQTGLTGGVNLTSGGLQIAAGNNVTISGDTNGDGMSDIVLTQTGVTGSLLTVASGATVTVSSLDFNGGSAQGSAYGGFTAGAVTNSGNLTINYSSLTNNVATAGVAYGAGANMAGAVVNAGTLTVNQSYFGNNHVTNGSDGNSGQDNYGGGPGGNGFNGGHSAGGILSLGSCTLNVNVGLFKDNSANGGNGGFGGFSYSDDGAGGNGGNAAANVLNFGNGNGVTQTTGGSAVAGAGGSGDPSGVAGTASNANLNPGTGIIVQTAGTTTSIGSMGNDTILIRSNVYSLTFAMSGNDTITVPGNTSYFVVNEPVVHAGAGNDQFNTVANSYGLAAKLFGDAGNDLFVLGQAYPINGNSELHGGSGNDTLDIHLWTETGDVLGNVTLVDLSSSYLGEAYFSGFENIIGSVRSETLLGSEEVNNIQGGDGDDVIDGRGGADVLNGGGNGTAGDTLSFDLLSTSGAYNGVQIRLEEGSTNATIFGNTNSATVGIIATNFENLTGSVSGDTLLGNSGNNKLLGGGGNDDLRGNGGIDFIDGGDGIDEIYYNEKTQSIEVTLNGSTAATVYVGGVAEDQVVNVEWFHGSNVNDVLTGDSNDNYFSGQLGDDFLNGAGGNDVIAGGGGNDQIDGGTGADRLHGLAGNDTFVVDDVGDIVRDEWQDGTGEGGYDEVKVVATSGSFTLTTYIERMTLMGTGNTNGTGNALNNYMVGNSGNNILIGGAGMDGIGGGEGDDVVIGGTEGDILDGGDNGANGDTLSYETSVAGVSVTLNDIQGVASAVFGGDAQGDNVTRFENVIGTSAVDTLIGNIGDNVLEGGGGADTLNGGAHGTGGDTVSYKSSDAAVSVNLATRAVSGGHATGDTINGFENVTGSAHADTLIGTTGNNVLKGLGGADSLNGVGGLHDVADYSDSDAGVSVNLSNGATSGGHAAGDVLIQIEDLTGSAFNDTLSANSYQNVLKGGASNDTMNAAGNNDQLFGEAGDDTLAGGTGADIINGGTNTAVGDTVSFANAAARITLTLVNGGGTATGSGQGAGDTITNIENITGSAFNDIFTGDANNNVINGLAGNDTLKGGAGNDTILGGGGLDVLEGGQGNDSITGGPDADTFVYRFTENFGQDTIIGWQNNSDKIDLIGAGFDFADFTKSQSGADTLLTLTADPTQTIRLIGINQNTIDATDFV